MTVLRQLVPMLARRDADDDFIGRDVGYPNARAQRAGYRMLVAFLFIVGIVALVAGLIQSFDQIGSAFPTRDSLKDGAAWAKFATGIGRTAVIGAIIILVAWFLRARMRRGR